MAEFNNLSETFLYHQWTPDYSHTNEQLFDLLTVTQPFTAWILFPVDF